MGSFVTRSKEIRERVGEGLLIGHLNVDQIYAYCQHEHLWWNTRHKYLTKALLEGNYFGDIARTIIPGGGRESMTRAVEDLNEQMASNAPKLTGALAGSGGPTVFDNGAVVYRRAPAVARKPGSNRGIAPHHPGANASSKFSGLPALRPGMSRTQSSAMKQAADTVTNRKRRA